MGTDHYDIFISYRRDGGVVYSDFLYEKLKQMGYAVFRDKQELGTCFFDEKIVRVILDCRDVLVVLSSRALDRCEQEDDWVRKEIRTALENGKKIIPLITSQFTWPENLPEDIARFRFANGLAIDDSRLSEDIEYILPKRLSSEPVNGQNGKIRLTSRYESPKSAFVGRDDLLESIHQYLENEGDTVALIGLGGVGKTEVARTYIHRYKHEYEHIVFAHFNDSFIDTFIDDNVFSLTGIHRMINETEKMESRENYFRRKLDAFKEAAGKNTLVVIDDLDWEEDLTDQSFFDFIAGDYQVIITTRHDVSEYIHGIFLTAETCRKDAMDVFAMYYGRRPKAEELKYVEMMLQSVNYHTLAIELIAKNMKTGHISPAKMKKMLGEKGLKALSGRVSAPQSARAADVAYEFIYSLYDAAGLDDDEKKTLCMMAIMPANGINVDDFMNYTEEDDFTRISQLTEKGWLSLNPESDILSIHPVIRDLVKEKLKPDEDICRPVIRAAERIWNKVQPDIRERHWQEVTGPLKLICLWLKNLRKAEDPFRRTACLALADAYFRMNCYSEAYLYYDDLCRLYMSEDMEVNAPESAMAPFIPYVKCLTNGLNRFKDAYSLSDQLLKLAEKTYGKESLQYLDYAELKANIAADLGYFEESHELRKLVADRINETPGRPDRDRICAMSALSNTLMYLNRRDEAYEVRKQVLDRAEALKLDRDGICATAQSNLALVLFSQGKSEDAAAMLKEAVSRCEQQKGSKNFLTLCMRTNYGAALARAGKPEAAAYNEQLYREQSQLWGADFDVTLKTGVNLHAAYMLAGDTEKAEAMYGTLEKYLTEEAGTVARIMKALQENREIFSAGAVSEGIADRVGWQVITLMMPVY